MKKIIITSFLVLGSGFLMAQDVTDALRYSQEELNGTARYKAMSGAFGALGGDLSAMAQNPAGSSVFNAGEFTISLKNSNLSHNINFLGNSSVSKDTDFSLNQLGTVFVFRNYTSDSNWKKFSIGFNYQKTRNFENDNLAYIGRNSNSIVDYFRDYASGFERIGLETNGRTISQAYRDIGINSGYAKQQAFMGLEGYLLDPKTNNPNEKEYVSRVIVPSQGVKQTYTLVQYGGARKYTFNFSGQYSDYVFLGLNLNSHSVDYSRTRATMEDKYDENSNVQQVNFENELHTTGGGFSLQLGAIVKATKDLRLGVTYQSPTWYTLQDETRQSLLTSVYLTSSDTQTITRDIVPNVTNIYEEYELRTPSQWTGSIAYLFGKKGLISLDYIYKGYGNANFGTKKDPDFIDVNKNIENLFADTNSVRLGGEFRVTPQFSVRGGYRFEQSPYKDKKLMGDLNGYSFGLGYNFGGLTLDLAYDFAHRDYQYQMYNVGLTDRANVKSDNHNLLLTLSMKL